MGLFSAADFIILIIIVSVLVPACLWCISYKKLLARFDKNKQKFSPNLAFLLLIPIFGLFWWGYLAFYVKNKLRKINEKRPFENHEDGGFIFAMLSIISFFLMGIIPSFYIMFAITAFLLWIFSWMKVVNARKLFRVRI